MTDYRNVAVGIAAHPPALTRASVAGDADSSPFGDAAAYARIARAIEFLDRAAPRQPELAEIAAAAGLSAWHFQRLFTRWAGVSPKRFLAHRAHFTASRLLADSRSLLDVAYESGLTGPGRLHDLFVRLVAMTPGEFRDGGAGLDIAYGIHGTPFGRCLLAVTHRGICSLVFLDDDAGTAHRMLHERWPAARLREDAVTTARTLERIFARWPVGGGEPLSVLVQGTNFQLRVWEALLRLEPGQVGSYGTIAAAVGAPRAVRAVGSAVARNPVALLIPCHRVIRQTGAFGEYRWGATRKRVILAWEAAAAAARAVPV